MRIVFMAAVVMWLAGARCAGAATHWVDGAATNATDDGPGTAEQPWRSITRAGGAGTLKPGDTVLIRSGVYRETAFISATGAPGRPITFAAAPEAKVVLKGSEVAAGPWTKVTPDPLGEASTTQVFRALWRTALDERFFTDPYCPGFYDNRAGRWVSVVMLNDRQPLQQVGPDPVYSVYNRTLDTLAQIGRGRDDVFGGAFWFDPSEQALYVRGPLPWCLIEVGVRGYVLLVKGAHDIVVRGLDVRHNRGAFGESAMAQILGSARVVIEDSRFQFSDHIGLSVCQSTNCTIRRCDASWNGALGINLHETADCTVEDCTMKFNNWRPFNPMFGSGGIKCIPSNVRSTIRRCEAAYNFGACGIWFDGAWLNKDNGGFCNRDIRILDNVCHHNNMGGIFHEVNAGGGVIAGNLCYANDGRGIAVSGFDPGPEGRALWVVHNTVADNNEGIVVMRRADDELARNVKVFNNLLLNNYMPGAELTSARGVDLQLEQPADPKERAAWSNEADGNVFADNVRAPILRPQWNEDRTLAQWRERYGQDRHSRALPVDWTTMGRGFRLTAANELDFAVPLPEDVLAVWSPANPARVGAERTAWLEGTGP